MKETVFELLRYCYGEKNSANKICFKVYVKERTIFEDLDHAVASMISSIDFRNSKNDAEETYCFVIRELKFGCKSSEFDEAVSVYTFTAKGESVAKSVVPHYSCDALAEYKGREEKDCPFKVGDFVERLIGDTVELHLITKMPPSPKDVENTCNYHKSLYHEVNPNLSEELFKSMLAPMDSQDDSYGTLNGSNLEYDSASVVSLFPVSRYISSRLKSMMNMRKLGL